MMFENRIKMLETHKTLLDFDKCVTDFIYATMKYKDGEPEADLNVLLDKCHEMYSMAAYMVLLMMKVDVRYLSKCMSIANIDACKGVSVTDAINTFCKRWATVDIGIESCAQLDFSEIAVWITEVYSCLLAHEEESGIGRKV